MRKKHFTLIFIGIAIIILCINIGWKNEHVRQFTYKAILGEHSIPAVYFPVYQAAAKEYNIPWELLASVHRVETIFSTMDPLISPIGALGHFQFMPRTWIGWSYPGDKKGQVAEHVDITDVTLIQTHQGYGVDANSNGVADPFDLEDSAYSAAKYLADHGAAKGDVEGALFAYNQSQDYVDEVIHFYEAYLHDYELVKLPFIK